MLHIACCTLRVACCTVRLARCTLRVACCTVNAACCALHGARCTSRYIDRYRVAGVVALAISRAFGDATVPPHHHGIRASLVLRATGLRLAPRRGAPRPHLRRDSARRCHICAGTGPTPATSAPGLGSPPPHLRRNWTRPCQKSAPELGSPLPTSAPGLRSPCPHLHRDWAHLFHLPGLGAPLPHPHQDWRSWQLKRKNEPRLIIAEPSVEVSAVRRCGWGEPN
jgi:hypothetical protein